MCERKKIMNSIHYPRRKNGESREGSEIKVSKKALKLLAELVLAEYHTEFESRTRHEVKNRISRKELG